MTERTEGTVVSVMVKPRSSRSQVLGTLDDGTLSIALKSPPVDGAANAELIKLLARLLGVKRRDVAIVRGATGKRKLVKISGIDRAALLERLP